jgi:predicted O-methyltransferase YrrM
MIEELQVFCKLLREKEESRIQKIERLEGWLHREQGEWLAFLASHVPHTLTIVELGSHKGRSTAWLSLGSRLGNKAPIYCVDSWCGNEKQQLPWSYPAFEENLRRLNLWERINPIHGLTVAVSKNWHTPIGLLFIDAGHDYEEALADYYAWYPFVCSGGWLVMHDTGILAGPTRVVEEVIKPSGLWTNFHDILQACVAMRK